jgi:hypothetical protein
MSDQNPPEQGSFGSPPPGSDPVGPPPGSSPAAGSGSVPPPPPPSSSVTPAGAGGGNAEYPSTPATTSPSAASTAMHSGADAIVDSSAGFLPALFDFSFTRFVTPKIVRFVYVLATVWAVLMYVLIVIQQFTVSIWAGIIALVFGPVLVLIWLAFVRIALEFAISIVRMSEDVHRRLPQA